LAFGLRDYFQNLLELNHRSRWLSLRAKLCKVVADRCIIGQDGQGLLELHDRLSSGLLTKSEAEIIAGNAL